MVSQDFEGLAKRDVVGRTTPEEAEALRSPECISDFVDFLTYLEATLEVQIQAFDAGRSRQTYDWRQDTNLFHLRVRARLAEMRPLLRAQNQRFTEPDLRAAIANHQAETLGAEYEPTEADKALWSSVSR